MMAGFISDITFSKEFLLKRATFRPRLGRLPHLPEVPHLNVKRPLITNVIQPRETFYRKPGL